jgi:hypothetical protein
MTVYECDSCLWLVTVSYEKQLVDTQSKFQRHNCDEKPLRRLAPVLSPVKT